MAMVKGCLTHASLHFQAGLKKLDVLNSTRILMWGRKEEIRFRFHSFHVFTLFTFACSNQ